MKTEKFLIVRGIKGNGDIVQRLINVENLEPGDELKDFFEPQFTTVVGIGEITIEGDTHLLGGSYIEEP